MIFNHTPKYISPSSYINYRKQPCKATLQRLLTPGENLPWEPQGRPAAVGSAFDALIKETLLKSFLADKQQFVLATVKKAIGYRAKHDESLKPLLEVEDVCTLLKMSSIEDPDFRNEALMYAHTYLLKPYLRIPHVQERLKQISDVEYHKYFVLESGVPCLGQLDGIYKKDGKRYPLDWKISGYNTPMSPKPGYKFSFVNGVNKGPHKKYIQDMPFDLICFEWAVQLCFYGWALGHQPGEEFEARIHGLFIRKGKVNICEYEGILTSGFQSVVYQDVLDLWDSLLDGSYSQMTPRTAYQTFAEMEFESWY